MSKEEVTTGLPAKASFVIGNAEITNLIVQDQVGKANARIAVLSAELEDSWSEILAIDEELGGKIEELLLKMWKPKLRAFIDSAYAAGFLSAAAREVRNSKLSFDVSERRMIWALVNAQTQYNGIPVPYKQDEVDRPSVDVSVPFRFIVEKEFAGEIYKDEISLPLDSGCKDYRNGPPTKKLKLTKPLLKLVSRAREIYNSRIPLIIERKELQAKLEEVDKIEKRVLAELTSRTIQANPGFLTQVSDIVASIESGPLQLTTED